MNKKEKAQLLRLYELMGKIPFPLMGGTKTPSVLGYVEFAVDMKQVYHQFRITMLAIIAKENYEGITPSDADTMLDAFDEWIKIRESAGWNNAEKAMTFSAVLAERQSISVDRK